jgi:hypothetical protein
MQWYMLIVQGAVLDNEEASEALLHLQEDMESSPLFICGWISSLLETRIKGASLLRDIWRSSVSEFTAVEVLFLLVGEPHDRAVICHL